VRNVHVCYDTDLRKWRAGGSAAGGPGWQVLRVSGRRVRGGFSTLAGHE
jgi:hypothetical protein